MRIVIHVQYFFTEEGQRAFPALLDECRELQRGTGGFMSVRRLAPNEPERRQECHALVEFENEAVCKAWTESPQHDRLAAKFRQYWTRPAEVRIFNVEA